MEKQAQPRGKGYSLLLLFLGLACLFIIKIPHLSLPFYWDEAYPYSYAVYFMAENGISLSPSAIPVELSKGHPLLFHFLSAGWITLFGKSVIAANLFPLLVSSLLIFFTWKAASELFSFKVGGIAALLTVVQAVFLAQATFLLPEMLLALFILLSLYFYMKKKHLAFVIFTTAALYTKESALVLPFSIGLFETARYTLHGDIKIYFKKIRWLLPPILLIGVFFILQKIQKGWFFYPQHIELMESEFSTWLSQLEAYSAYLFIYYGRNAVSAVLLFSLFIRLFTRKGKKVSSKVGLLSTFIIAFILFSSANFFSPRYLLCCIPLFGIIAAYFTERLLPEKRPFFLLAAAILSAAPFYFSLRKKSNVDHNLGYVQAVKVQQDAIDYCLENYGPQYPVATGFLTFKSISSPYPGYVKENEVFSRVTTQWKSAEKGLLLMTNTDFDKREIEKVEKGEKWSKIVEFRQGESVAGIYKIKTSDP